MDNKNRSEYDGGGVMPNTVYPKGEDALTASDKLRLQSITGQEEDSHAPVDPYFWVGNTRPDPAVDRAIERAQKQKNAQIRKLERDRYKESPVNPY